MNEGKLGAIASGILKEAGYQEGVTIPVNQPENQNAPANTPAPADTPNVDAQAATPADAPPVNDQPAPDTSTAPQQQPQAQAVPDPANTLENPAPPQATSISDQDLLRELSAKLGREITSLDELNQPPRVLTPEEQAQEVERVRAEATKYGLDNKLFTTKDLESYAVEKGRTPRETALEVFAQAIKSQNLNIGDEEIRERFSEWAFENEEDGHPLKAMKAQEMERIHNDYISSKYGAIAGIEGTYNEHATAIRAASEFGKKLDSAIASFVGDGSKPHVMTFSVGEGQEPYAYEVAPEVFKAIKESYQSGEVLQALGEKANDAKFINEIIINEVKSREFDKILFRVAESHKAKALLDFAAEREGVVPQRTPEANQNPGPKKLGGIAGGILEGAKTASVN